MIFFFFLREIRLGRRRRDYAHVLAAKTAKKKRKKNEEGSKNESGFHASNDAACRGWPRVAILPLKNVPKVDKFSVQFFRKIG